MKNINEIMIKLAKLTFKYSFILGTILLLLGIFTKEMSVAYVGLIYLIAALSINLLVFSGLLLSLLGKESDPRKTVLTAAIMLVNLPIAFLYFWIWDYFN